MVETLGEAWMLGWTCTARCQRFNPTSKGRRMLWCDKTYQIDMLTLVITRGERFNLVRIQEVLR